MKAMNHTESVLSFHGVARESGGSMDFGPLIKAMLRLCEEQRLDNRPVEHLRHIKGAVDQLRGSLDPGELKTAQESAAQYEEWLCSTFPKAFDQMRNEASERIRKQALN
jgi:hypothetical protein